MSEVLETSRLVRALNRLGYSPRMYFNGITPLPAETMEEKVVREALHWLHRSRQTEFYTRGNVVKPLSRTAIQQSEATYSLLVNLLDGFGFGMTDNAIKSLLAGALDDPDVTDEEIDEALAAFEKDTAERHEMNAWINATYASEKGTD